MGEADMSWMDEIDQYVSQRYSLDFSDKRPYKNAPGSRFISDIWYSAQKGLRNFVAPVEYLVPAGFRPFQKLIGDRDPIEHYEWARMFGTQTAIWDSPIHDWFRPSWLSLKANLGFKDKPGWRREADSINEEFDRLEYVKYLRLANEAEMYGDSQSASKYYSNASRTIAGLGPQSSLQDVFFAMSNEERGYLNAFAQAQGRDRQRILEIVPEDLAGVYQGIWNRLDSGDPTLYQDLPVSPEYLKAHYDQVLSGIENMPDPSWVGFNDGVNIDDIKVKYVSELGKDIHDYGIWESQVRNIDRMPYLEGSTDYLYDYRGLSRVGYNFDSSPGNQYNISRSVLRNNSVQLTYNDSRDQDVRDSVNRMFR